MAWIVGLGKVVAQRKVRTPLVDDRDWGCLLQCVPFSGPVPLFAHTISAKNYKAVTA